jgi:hypothetical protein
MIAAGPLQREADKKYALRFIAVLEFYLRNCNKRQIVAALITAWVLGSEHNLLFLIDLADQFEN